MAQQPEIVPQGSVAEKYQRPSTPAKRRSMFRLELVLVVLVLLFLAFVFAVLILGSLNSISNANQYLPTAPASPK